MAYSPAAGDSTNAAPKLLGVTGTLLISALCIFSARFHQVLRQRQLGWDALTITVALAFALVEWSLIAGATQYGLGRRDASVSLSDQVVLRHLVFVSESLWIISVVSVRISIASTLLQLKHLPFWRIFLWTLITVQAISCIASFIFQLLQCNPLAYMWNPSAHPAAVCVSQSAEQANMYVHSGIGTATDFMLAMVPISFMRTSRLPLRETIALWSMVAFGLFATASSITKMLRTNLSPPGRDDLYTATDDVLWSFLEQQAGIIAACIPALKPLFTRMANRSSDVTAILRPNTDDEGAVKLRHTRTNSDHEPFRRFTLTPTPTPFALNLMLPNPSTTTASSMLHHTHDLAHDRGPISTPRSAGTVWPAASDTHLPPTPHSAQLDEGTREQMLVEGGILMTTEFQVKSEGVSRVGSPDGEMEKERRREIEEWRVERPSTEMRMRGWDVV